MTRSPEFNPEQWLNLADASLGAQVISVTDDFFAEAKRMLQPTEPDWQPDAFDDNGKWMDGWESRRKRGPGHDHAVVRLGVAGVIKGFDIDTRYFTGNYPPSASVEACYLTEGEPDITTEWTEILPSVALQGDSHHIHSIDDDRVWSHLRLHIYPDGGVARLRVYGVPHRNWSQHPTTELVDLAAALNGGRSLACSDSHYGKTSNLIKPERSPNMGDGWETARRRTPGYDWVILALGHAGSIQEAIIDTQHFKGNYPDSCSIQAAFIPSGSEHQIEAQSLYWSELLPEQKLSMDTEHHFKNHLKDIGPVTHIRLNIFPDGGVSRVRLIGLISK